MDEFECPSGLKNNACTFSAIRGSVRDATSVGVKKCQECSLVIHSESLTHLVNYESGSMSNWWGGLNDRMNRPLVDIERRFDSIIQLSKTFFIDRVLDFGSGDGQMIKKFCESFHAEGLEPEKSAREICLKAGVRVHSDIETLKKTGETFDAISMFHVIEHVYQPSDLLRQLKGLLRPNGLLLIETPNSMDALLTIYECVQFQNFTYWSHHPMLYSPAALSTLVERSGFKIIEAAGIQRYGLENHMHWLAKGLPGGHEAWRDLFSSAVNREYALSLNREGVSDTLWLVAINA